MKVVGACVVGPGEAKRYLRLTMDDFSRLCDEVVVVTNNVGLQERGIISQHGFKQYEDNREWGAYQRQIKERLHAAIGQLKPDWVLCLDADEHFGNLDRKGLQWLTTQGLDAWHFLMVDLWDDGYKPDLGFWKVQLYKYKFGQIAFTRWGFDPGLVPEWAATSAGYAPVYILHSGLKKAEDRVRRLERYAKYDPEAKGLPQSYYDALASKEPAVPLDEEKLRQDLRKEFITIYGHEPFSFHQA